jgi:hypothetical protein
MVALRKLIERLCSEIVLSVSKSLREVEKDKFLVCHYNPFELCDDDGNIVRCLLEYEFPQKLKKKNWFKMLPSMFNWMQFFSFHELDRNPDDLDRNMLAMRAMAISGKKVLVVPDAIAAN